MRYLSQFNPEIVREILSQDYPNFPIHSIRLIDHGWDNHVAEINGSYIFRFPKHPNEHSSSQSDSAFQRELHLLSLLQGKFSLKTPDVSFIGKSTVFMGYRMINGVHLTPTLIANLSPHDQELLISDSAQFLQEFHRILSIAEAEHAGYCHDDPMSYHHFASTNLVPKISEPSLLHFIHTTLAEYEAMLNTPTEEVLLHGDLHMENMAFDPESKRLRGVFDFGDVAIGDVHIDFYPLYKYDPFFMKAVAERYTTLTGRSLDLRRILIYCRVGELCDWAEYIDKPHSSVYRQATERVRRWQNEAEMFL